MSEKNEKTGIEESNPNAAGPAGLAGGMGVSSERTDPQESRTVEGTGTVGSAAGRTDGSVDTSPGEQPDAPAKGPAMDERQNDAEEEWRD